MAAKNPVLVKSPRITPTNWSLNNLTKATGAPAASGTPIGTGAPHGYTYAKDGTEHVVYHGIDGNVHELWFDTGWHHNNLSLAVGNVPSPSGDLFGYTWSRDLTEHVVYRATNGHIIELWFNGSWHINDLTSVSGAPIAEGNPVGHTYEVDGTEHVFYRAPGGHIFELWNNISSGWQFHDLTDATGAPTTGADPCSYVYPKDNTQHVVFIANAHLQELWYNGSWHHNDLTVASGATANAMPISRPTGYFYAKDNTEHVVYRCNDGSIEELWFSTSWAHNLISAATGAPHAGSDPVGYTWSHDLTEHVLYRGLDGDIHELWFDGAWHHNDLTLAVNPVAPKATGTPTGYEWTKDGTEHAVYISVTGDIIELWL